MLIKFARRLEAISDSARRALSDVKQQLRHFTVGITPSCGEALIGRVFSSYCGAHPHTNISIVTDTMDQLCSRLGSYELDFAIVDGTVSLKHCHTELLDLDYLCVVMSPRHALAKRSGGKLVPVIRRTVQIMEDRIQVKEEIRTLTASRRFEQKIMNGMPVLMVLYIDTTSPGFFDGMYTTMAGRAVMTGCLAVYLLSCWLSGKILDIRIS